MENQLILNEDAWVCKDNRLVNASYKLSTGELKLILAISSMVNPFDEEFKDYVISIKDFAKLLDVNLSTNKNFYSRVKRASGLLLSKRVTIHEKDGDFQTVWLSGIKYYDNEGKVAVSFHPKLKKYYLQLKKYTKYRLKNITNLNSEYSLKLYEILKQYEKIGERIYDVEELKKFLGIEKQYDRFYDFKRRILLVTQKEIGEKTDISFEFEEIKTGRSITNLKFYITSKNEKKTNETVTICEQLPGQIGIKEVLKLEQAATDEEIIDNMITEKELTKLKAVFIKHQLSNQSMKIIYEDCGRDIECVRACYMHCLDSNTPIGNVVGYMRKLAKSYEPPVPYEPIRQVKKNKFLNFHQTRYDFDEIEQLEMKRQIEKLKKEGLIE